MSSRFLLPGHRYLGPGNPLNNGEPVNRADYIARRHDYRYNEAQEDNHIYEADQDAILEFYNNIPENPLSSSIGAVGLGIKHLVEKSLGKVIYPRIPGKYEKNTTSC